MCTFAGKSSTDKQQSGGAGDTARAKDDPSIKEKVRQIVDMTHKSEEEALYALHDCDHDVQSAINILYEKGNLQVRACVLLRSFLVLYAHHFTYYIYLLITRLMFVLFCFCAYYFTCFPCILLMYTLFCLYLFYSTSKHIISLLF